MVTLTLRNDYHGTTARVRPRHVAPAGGWLIVTLSQSQWSRARRKLCNVASCACGGGMCGPQRHDGMNLFVKTEK